MVKLVHRYGWLMTSIFLLSGISLLLWLHQDKWPSPPIRTTLTQSSKLNYAEFKLPVIPSNKTSKPEFKDFEKRQDPHKNNKRPKVYIYALSPKFTEDVLNCLTGNSLRPSCFNLSNNGFGNLSYKEGEMEVYNTNQFSLEVIMHYQLINSEYVTDNPSEADVFYIPDYLGVMFYCGKLSPHLKQMHEALFQEVNSLPYFRMGKPHLSALGKIEREMASIDYPLLQNPHSKKVTYITIEREAKYPLRRFLNILDQSVIVAPYPSYVHRNDFMAESQEIASPPIESRNVFLLLAASVRRSNPSRALLLDQFTTYVQGKSYVEFINSQTTREIPSQVMLVTPDCFGKHYNTTINWMQNSVFCLQPHGDSPTRKSFYDGIQGGCIPVIFRYPEEDVEYPFQSVLNYTDFMVTIESSKITKDKENVFDILKRIPEYRINMMHRNVLKVARQLQYSKQDRSKPKKYIDALDMIMDQVRKKYNL